MNHSICPSRKCTCLFPRTKARAKPLNTAASVVKTSWLCHTCALQIHFAVLCSEISHCCQSLWPSPNPATAHGIATYGWEAIGSTFISHTSRGWETEGQNFTQFTPGEIRFLTFKQVPSHSVFFHMLKRPAHSPSWYKGPDSRMDAPPPWLCLTLLVSWEYHLTGS